MWFVFLHFRETVFKYLQKNGNSNPKNPAPVTLIVGSFIDESSVKKETGSWPQGEGQTWVTGSSSPPPPVALETHTDVDNVCF